MAGYEKIAILENEFEAQLLQAALEERNIPCHIRSYHDIAYDGLYQMTKGWGAVYAPPFYKQVISQTLDFLRKSSQTDNLI